MASISTNKPDIDYTDKQIVTSYQSGSYTLLTGSYANIGNGMSITIPRAGDYRISAQINIDINWTTNNALGVYYRFARDGVGIPGTYGLFAKNITTTFQCDSAPNIVSPILFFAADEVITVQAYKSNIDTATIPYSSGVRDGYIEAEQVKSYVTTSPAFTNWVSYSMTIGATSVAPTKGTMVVDNAQWKRMGNDMELLYSYRQSSTGAAGTGTYLFPLPTGYAIDTTIMPGNASGNFATGNCGSLTCYNGSNYYSGVAMVYNSTNLCLMYSAPGAMISSGGMNLGSASTLLFSYRASVPITGWS